MPKWSIFNDVLGPIMIGPSSSHTAGPARLGLLARTLLGEEPVDVRISFDPRGSLAYTYRGQGSDRGFTAGLLGLAPDDPRLKESPGLARERGVNVHFHVEELPGATHPNTARLELRGEAGGRLLLWGASVGGGMIRIEQLFGRPVHLTGGSHDLLLLPGEGVQLSDLDGRVEAVLREHGVESHLEQRQGLLHRRLAGPLPPGAGEELKRLPGVAWLGRTEPVLPVPDRPGQAPLAGDAAAMVRLALERQVSLGRLGLEYEMHRAGWSEAKARREMARVLAVMRESVRQGLTGEQRLAGGLVEPSARRIEAARRQGRLIAGSPVSRAVAMAIAVMEVSNSMGVICAAPTAGSSGTLPGAVLAFAEEYGATDDRLIEALFAAGAVGLIIARKATFAAEEGGCQAENGSASAMAAAALVELAGGGPQEAMGAASVALQNMLGLVCDPVAGLVEVPCFGRNAIAVSNAYAAADMVLGGYDPLIPFDEMVVAMKQVSAAMPHELRCTALGGCAATPTGLRLKEEYEQRLSVLGD